MSINYFTNKDLMDENSVKSLINLILKEHRNKNNKDIVYNNLFYNNNKTISLKYENKYFELSNDTNKKLKSYLNKNNLVLENIDYNEEIFWKEDDLLFGSRFEIEDRKNKADNIIDLTKMRGNGKIGEIQSFNTIAIQYIKVSTLETLYIAYFDINEYRAIDLTKISRPLNPEIKVYVISNKSLLWCYNLLMSLNIIVPSSIKNYGKDEKHFKLLLKYSKNDEYNRSIFKIFSDNPENNLENF